MKIKKYIINRSILTIVAVLYAMPLMTIINGESIWGRIDTVIIIIGFAIIGCLSSIFVFKDKAIREYEQEKIEKDERYINNRKTFSYYLLIALAMTIPIVLIILDLYGIEQISISSLTIIFLIISFVYMIALEIIRKKV
ncbi:TPA: 2'-O-methyl transferase [Listeria innocua]|nr:2'-O-methyl transferase [Listeria innocua]MBC1408566.1 2'-O-methyl transferase [Listeria innocua]HBM3438169.1 2'-O-methyl transferase [Listeria innocua]HBM3451650.1 2'-O-methyl transferase [Listeria innocua]HBM3497315.1 2'-O-methyl transferase [Listeria innocua]